MFPINGFVPFMGGVASARGTGDGDTVEGGPHIGGHGEVDVAVASIAPVDRKAQKFGAGAIDCGCVEVVD